MIGHDHHAFAIASGNAGDDIVTGGSGTDSLSGGAGNDTFIDTKAGLNGDTITDFSAAEVTVQKSEAIEH